MQQKHFMDIDRLKEFDTEIGDGVIVPSNSKGFEKGDLIQISEKWDGSNASIRYCEETNSLIAFSRKYELSFDRNLNGFWNFVQSLNAEDYKDTPNYVIFGEWGNKNAIQYSPEFYGKWYVYDIYDTEKEQYLPQVEVKKFVRNHNLTYIHVLYDGEFISWDHCRTFCNSPAYGEKQEGIVVKNQTKLSDPNNRQPFVLKIVNDSFSEIKKENRKRKLEDPQNIKEKEIAQSLMESIVTRRRVEKELYKMRDEGILPNMWTEQEMSIIAKNLPKRIYEDCIKEEKDIVMQAGKYAGKYCGHFSMKYARDIILGSPG